MPKPKKTPKVCGDCKWFRQIAGEELTSERGDCTLDPIWVRKTTGTFACSHFHKEP